MTPTPREILLMHAALDGEATAEELQELDRLLAADAEARAEYDALRHLFGALQALPEFDPPPGLAESAARRGQLRLSQRVVVQTSGSAAPALPNSAGTPRGLTMSQKLSKYTILGGSIVAAATILVVGRFVLNVPSHDEAIGTVAPAERYRAKQVEASDVKLGDQAITQLMQTESFERIIKDPQMRALALDPGFQALARNPEALAALARAPEAVAALARNPEALAALARNPEAMAALARSPDAIAVLARSPEAMAVLVRSPDAVAVLARSPEAMAALGRSPEAMAALARNPQAFSAMARDSGFHAMAMSPGFAQALVRVPNAAASAETK